MVSNEADSKTYVMETNHNHAQEFAKVAPALGSNTAERRDTATNYMQRTSGKQIRTRAKLCGTNVMHTTNHTGKCKLSIGFGYANYYATKN